MKFKTDKTMRTKNIIYLLTFVLLTSFALTSCGDSKKIPDFTGVYNGTTEISYYHLNYKSKVYLRASESKDPYKVDMEIQLIKNNIPVVYKFKNLIIDNRTATDSYFVLKGKEKGVDFGPYGIADLDIEGTREGRSLDLKFLADFTHKTEIVEGIFLGTLLNRKENNKADVEKITIDSPLVPNIVLNEEKNQFTVYVNKDTPDSVLKELKVNITVSEGATYTQSSQSLDPNKPMVITVLSEDQSVTKEYTVVVSYVAIP